MQWSRYQEKIFNTLETTNLNIVVKATAGSGKTTTIVEMTNRINNGLSSLLLAFNKGIADTLKNRVQSKQCKVSTIHSLGFTSIRKLYNNNCKLNPYKVNDIAKKILNKSKKDKRITNIYKSAAIINKYVSLYRLNDCKNMKMFSNILLRNNETVSAELDYVKPVLAALNKYNSIKPNEFSLEKPFEINYDDMVCIAANNTNIILPKYDIVFLDEAQDANRLMQKIVFKSLKSTGKFVVVGDSKQSIYLFSGADPNSFSNFESQKNTVILSLPKSYRCPKPIVKLAREWYPEMEWNDDNIKADIKNVNILKNGLKKGSYVLCRFNAPLFDAYLKLNKKGYDCVFKDKNIGENLKNLIISFEKSNTTFDLYNFFMYLCKMRQKTIDFLISKKAKNILVHPFVKNFDEKVRNLAILSENLTDTKELLNLLEKMFYKKVDTDTIMLMSIHKSKGLENDNIYIIRPDLMPSKKAKTPESLEQEKNLMFVATTRSKYGLYKDNINFYRNKKNIPHYYTLYKSYNYTTT